MQFGAGKQKGMELGAKMLYWSGPQVGLGAVACPFPWGEFEQGDLCSAVACGSLRTKQGKTTLNQFLLCHWDTASRCVVPFVVSPARCANCSGRDSVGASTVGPTTRAGEPTLLHKGYRDVLKWFGGWKRGCPIWWYKVIFWNCVLWFL